MKICSVMRRTVKSSGLSAPHLGKVPGNPQAFFERRICDRDIPLALIDLKAAFVREGELLYAAPSKLVLVLNDPSLVAGGLHDRLNATEKSVKIAKNSRRRHAP
jgi:hypothetical protein